MSSPMFQADVDTDEVYAQMTLQPLSLVILIYIALSEAPVASNLRSARTVSF